MQTFLLERVRDHVLVANVQVFHGVPPSPYYDGETARAEERERTGIARLSWYTCVRNTRSIVLWVAIITSSHINVEPSMPVSVVWKWKADEYPQPTGSSISRSSPQEAFDEQGYLLPLNRVECAKCEFPNPCRQGA